MAKTISQLTAASAAAATNLFEISEGSGDPVVYSSKKLTLAQLAQAVAGVLTYNGLDTTSKTLIGAINEAASSGGITPVTDSLTLANDWTEDSYYGGAYYKKVGNIVYLHIWAASITISNYQLLLTLPQDIRPAHDIKIPTCTNTNSYSWINIESSGDVYLCSTDNQTSDIQLDCCYMI